MDGVLRRLGFGRAYVLLLALTFPAVLVEDDGLFRWVTTTAGVFVWPLALRAGALRGDAERGGADPPPRTARVRRFVVRWRWPLAIGWAAWAASGHVRYGSRPVLTALAIASALAGVAYAARPLPVTDSPSPEESTTTVSPSRI